MSTLRSSLAVGGERQPPSSTHMCHASVLRSSLAVGGERQRSEIHDIRPHRELRSSLAVGGERQRPATSRQPRARNCCDPRSPWVASARPLCRFVSWKGNG